MKHYEGGWKTYIITGCAKDLDSWVIKLHTWGLDHGSCRPVGLQKHDMPGKKGALVSDRAAPDSPMGYIEPEQVHFVGCSAR